jgi:hypothetical protein
VPPARKPSKVIKTGTLDKAVKLSGLAVNKGAATRHRGSGRQHRLTRTNDYRQPKNPLATINPAQKSGTATRT